MMRSVIVLCVIGVSSVLAYDYQDSVFNEFLLRELIEASDITGESSMSQVLREKRQADNDDERQKCKPGHNGDHWKCCNEEFRTPEMREKMNEYKKECFNEMRKAYRKNENQEDMTDRPNEGKHRGGFGSGGPPDMMTCGGLHHGKKEMFCVAQCIGQKLKLVDADGNINESAMRTHIKTQFGITSWLKGLTDKILDKCLAEGQTNRLPKDIGNDPTCNRATLKFAHCLFKEINIACPIEKQKDTKRCQMIREGPTDNDMKNY